MRCAHAALCAALLCVLDPGLVLCFNLDTAHVIRKDGDPGSLFGFSLAMHRQLNPDKRILLIGAPRARALGKQTANITGGLYRCEVTQSNDCDRIEFDTEEDIRSENKENQWMGVTVQSQGPGGKIVTCAHRYQRRLFANTPQESSDIIGRCYVLSQDLTIDTTSDEDGGNWNFCEGRARGHQMFGSCQQGLAATFTKDYHYVVFGAPGAYNWKGIVRVEQKNNTLVKMEVYDDGPYEVGDENVLNPELVPVPANSYLGFSLDSGHSITWRRGLTVVAGAPRANHSGAVVLLRKDSETSNRLSEEYILYGPGLGSSFGYDVAVVDLNHDGWQDIVVGAPQFYMKDRDIGGAVYVYINKAGRWDNIVPIRLNGTKGSMFGQSVENIGDINQDSYEDIAVGAPYDDAGAGKVYIYHGSAQGINTTPAQVILTGKEHNIQFFGYSLAGNMDLDTNSYPDLAVGSLSDTALIYRARPVINIHRNIKIHPQEIDLSVKTCGDSICLTVDACFSYRANHASYSQRLTVSYSVEADGVRRKLGQPSRVMFLNKSRTETDYYFNGTLDLRGQNQETCIKLKDNIKDKLRSIPIEVSAEIVGTKRQRTKNGLPPLMPVLDSSQPSKDVTEVSFLKEGCGSDLVCRSNLKMQYRLFYKQSNQDLFFPVPVKNNIPVFNLNYERKDLALQVTVNNMNGDDAYEAKLNGTFPDTLSYSGVRPHQTITCNANPNGSQAECELGNPFKRDSEVQTSQFYTIVNSNTVHFGGMVKGESAMKTEEEIGSLINYHFTINNLWRSLKPSVQASLHIQWPKSDKNGKWLLYLVKITAKEGPHDIRCSPESEINPLKQIKESSASRTKREIGERKAVKKVSDQRKKVLVRFGLSLKCVVLKCPLQGLDGTTVELRSRLWNSTFLEDYSLLRRSDSKWSDLLKVTVTVYPPNIVTPYGGVPWWIILVAVLAGILILALLVYLLWKCGFFNRSKQDDNVPRYHAVRIRKESPEVNAGKVKLDAFDKKQWMTTWIDNESYS
uniref:Integrin alpha-2 domain-containing protein n=1 Tax=Sphaeramia orbicularis TaxID=375764 RepID=A0A673ACU9_9TELE